MIWDGDTTVNSCAQYGCPKDADQCRLDWNTALLVIQH